MILFRLSLKAEARRKALIQSGIVLYLENPMGEIPAVKFCRCYFRLYATRQKIKVGSQRYRKTETRGLYIPRPSKKLQLPIRC